jgi:tetratricopeptide (TPR) repeat protein
MVRCLVVVMVALACGHAHAQREFVEEIEPRPGLNDADLDAPDPAATKKPPPTTSPTKLPTTSPTPTPEKTPKGKPRVTETPTPTPVATPPPPPAVDEVAPLTINTAGRAGFREQADQHFAALQRGDLTRARKALTALERGALDFAVHGARDGFAAPALAQALLREARTAIGEGRADDAETLLQMSERIAPSDLATAGSRLFVRFELAGPVAALGDIGNVWRALWTHPKDAGFLVARVGTVFVVTIVVMLLLLAVIVALPTLPTMAFDLMFLLPRQAHRGQALVIAALVAAAPLLLGAGLVPALLWVLTLGMAYLGRRRQVAVALVVLVAIAMPTLVQQVAMGWTASSSQASDIADALYDVDGADALARLKATETAGGALDVLAGVALANAARRDGRLDEALERYRALVQRHGDLSWVHGGYGVVLADAGQDELALAELGLAAERARAEPHAESVVVAAAFNASVLHHKAGRTEKAQALLAPIAETDADALAIARRATFRALDEVVGHNRAFVEVLPPRAALFALPSSPATAAVEQSVAAVLWRGASTTTATAIIAAFLVAMGAVTVLAQRLKLARACVRCGEPASRRVDGPDVPHDTCAACFHAFVSTKSRIDAGVKLRKENAIRRRNRRRATTIVALSLLPGTGHLFAGAMVRGVAFAALATSSACAAVTLSPAWPGPRAAADIGAMAAMVPGLVVFAIVFAASFRSALGVADDERSTR